MKQDEHLTHELLVSALDDELLPEEAAAAERHFAQCETCKREYETLRTLSVRLGAVVSCSEGHAGNEMRARLSAAMESCEEATVAARPPRRTLRTLGWGTAIAAGVAVAILSISWAARHGATPGAQTTMQASNGTINVGGETFLPLPYSNPDLPVGAPRIVEMQVPIVALADAGVSFEPISTEAANSDGSVLADVLIGLDGEPMGIHVLSTP